MKATVSIAFHDNTQVSSDPLKTAEQRILVQRHNMSEDGNSL